MLSLGLVWQDFETHRYAVGWVLIKISDLWDRYDKVYSKRPYKSSGISRRKAPLGRGKSLVRMT